MLAVILHPFAAGRYSRSLQSAASCAPNVTIVFYAVFARTLAHMHVKRAVAVEYPNAAHHHIFKNLALGIGNRLNRAEKIPYAPLPTVVIAARCGCTILVRCEISPAWFMPISNTANCVDGGIFARFSGVPIWLLVLPVVA